MWVCSSHKAVRTEDWKYVAEVMWSETYGAVWDFDCLKYVPSIENGFVLKALALIKVTVFKLGSSESLQRLFWRIYIELGDLSNS